MEKEKLITLSTLKQRGWTEELIEKLLPEPKLVPNPHYRSAGKMKLWKENEVMKAEQDKRFIEIKTKKQKRAEKKMNAFVAPIETKNPANDYPKARVIKRHFIIYTGGTNTGKTYRALQALKTANSGVYLAPLRLLAMEIQDTMLADGVLCSMVTGEEENIIPCAKHMSSTVEKLNINEQYDVGVIDECQMIADNIRGGAWTRAILGLCAKTVYLCMSEDALNICIKLIEFCGDTYEIHYCERKVPLEFVGAITAKDFREGDAFILFTRKNVLEFSEDLNRIGLKSSVVYGALPYQSRKEQVRLYNEKETHYIVSTDAIGMGLNLPIRRIVFVDSKKFDGVSMRNLLPSEIKQIAGRAGRFGMYDKGEVAVLAEGEADSHLISSGLTSKLQPIEHAHIPFPEELINHNNNKVSAILQYWYKVKYPDIFVQPNIDITIERAKYLEKSYPNISKGITYKLSNIMFDEKSSHLAFLWQTYCDKYINGKKIEIPDGFATTLEDCEMAYKELDLYYSFCKTTGLPIDTEKLKQEKEAVVFQINMLLLEASNRKKQRKKCRVCGKKLPLFSKYNICDACYYGEF